MVLQVTSEQHDLLCVEAHAAGVGCKDCAGQKPTQVRGEVGRQGRAGQHIGRARVSGARHKYELAVFLHTCMFML